MPFPWECEGGEEEAEEDKLQRQRARRTGEPLRAGRITEERGVDGEQMEMERKVAAMASERRNRERRDDYWQRERGIR